jgi:hypothetical protein
MDFESVRSLSCTIPFTLARIPQQNLAQTMKTNQSADEKPEFHINHRPKCTYFNVICEGAWEILFPPRGNKSIFQNNPSCREINDEKLIKNRLAIS